MAGVAGRSGRKSKTDEERRLAIIDKAWDVVNEFLISSETTVDKKVVEAVKIVLKSMPSNDTNYVSMKVTMMPAIEKDGKELRYNLGH